MGQGALQNNGDQEWVNLKQNIEKAAFEALGYRTKQYKKKVLSYGIII